MDRIHHPPDLRPARLAPEASTPRERDASRNLLRLEDGTLYIILGTGQWPTAEGQLHVAHVACGAGAEPWQVCATDRLASALAEQLGISEGQTLEVGPGTLDQLHVAIESYDALRDAERSFKDLMQVRRPQPS